MSKPRTKQAKPRRKHERDIPVTIRLKPNHIACIKLWQRTFGMSRSEVLRTWLAYRLSPHFLTVSSQRSPDLRSGSLMFCGQVSGWRRETRRALESLPGCECSEERAVPVGLRMMPRE
jgi:hypothetical protein